LTNQIERVEILKIELQQNPIVLQLAFQENDEFYVQNFYYTHSAKDLGFIFLKSTEFSLISILKISIIPS
jgi:hypothetical protein